MVRRRPRSQLTRFGCPFQIFTSQGRNFESQLFQAVCEALHIHKARTTPYRPSANGQVERYNRTLRAAIRCFVGKHQRDWDVWLPQLAEAIRASVNRSTGFTPNKLMLGREVTQTADLVFKGPKGEEGEGLDQYMIQLEEAMREAHQVARTSF